MDKVKSVEYAKLATKKLTLPGDIPKEKHDSTFNKNEEDFFVLIDKSLEYDSTNTYALYWKGKIQLQNLMFNESYETFNKYLKHQTYDFTDDHLYSVNKTMVLLKRKLGLGNYQENLDVLYNISNDRLKQNPRNTDNITLMLSYYLFAGEKREALVFIENKKKELVNVDYYNKLIFNFNIEQFVENLNDLQ